MYVLHLGYSPRLEPRLVWLKVLNVANVVSDDVQSELKRLPRYLETQAPPQWRDSCQRHGGATRGFWVFGRGKDLPIGADGKTERMTLPIIALPTVGRQDAQKGLVVWVDVDLMDLWLPSLDVPKVGSSEKRILQNFPDLPRIPAITQDTVVVPSKDQLAKTKKGMLRQGLWQPSREISHFWEATYLDGTVQIVQIPMWSSDQRFGLGAGYPKSRRVVLFGRNSSNCLEQIDQTIEFEVAGDQR